MTETTKFLRNWQVILGQLLAQVSDRMTGLGLIWVVTEKFGENWVTWYLVIGGLPHLLLSPVSARVISKVGAISTVISADLIRFLLFFCSNLRPANRRGNSRSYADLSPDFYFELLRSPL